MLPEVVEATDADVESWLEIVREVEPLFGPMPDFAGVLRRNIARRSALGVRQADGNGYRVIGGLLLGGLHPDCWIRWLAVRSDARGAGVGAALLAEAIARCEPPCRISLDTFGADNPDGRAARALYLRFGFEAGPMVERGPEGGTRQRFVLDRGEARPADAWTRLAADVLATAGRELELLPEAGPGLFTEIHVFLDGEPAGAFGRAFSPDPETQLAEVADAVQEHVLHEAVWGGWPMCPDHGTHPLDPRVNTDGVAAWFCPRGRCIAAIGHLSG